MSRLFIFAVGGTGARVLRSFTMLLASGLPGFDSATEIVPIIIDHDRECGDKRRAVNALDSYNAINRALYPAGVAFNDNFFMTRVTPLGALGGGAMGVPNEWCLDFGIDGNAPMKFSEYIGYDTIEADTHLQETLGLLKALYDTSDDESPTAELNLNLKVGFKGKPNIGTVVFNEISNTREFKHFLDQCAGTDKVFVIGSLFGGTGSSGIPEIVKAIRNSGQPCATVQIGAVLMLPYFKLQPHCAGGVHDGINTGAINSSMFNAKTKVALGSYGVGGAGSINHSINTIYYVGDEVSCTANEYNEGSTGQVNPAHVAEFVAAQAIVDFWTTGYEGPYEFGTKVDGEAQALDLTSFYDITHAQSLDSLSAFVIAMRYYREVVCGDRNRVSTDASFYSNRGFDLGGKLKQGVYANVDKFLGMPADGGEYANDWGFYPWLEELSRNQHSLKPYRVRTNGKELKDVLSHIAEYHAGFGRRNPLRDNNMSDEMNNSSRSTTPKDDTNFFKVLRVVCKRTYNQVKNN